MWNARRRYCKQLYFFFPTMRPEKETKDSKKGKKKNKK